MLQWYDTIKTKPTYITITSVMWHERLNICMNRHNLFIIHSFHAMNKYFGTDLQNNFFQET